MKITKFLLILYSLFCFQSIGYCYSSSSEKVLEKVYWQGSSPSAVAAQANKMQSLNPSESYTDDGQAPIIDPFSAYGNMFQMMNTDPYSAVEQRKLQSEYAKQQQIQN